MAKWRKEIWAKYIVPMNKKLKEKNKNIVFKTFHSYPERQIWSMSKGSATIGESSSCSKWEQIQSPNSQTSCREGETLEHLAVTVSLHQIPSLRYQGTLQKRQKKPVRTRGNEGRQGTLVVPKSTMNKIHMNSQRLKKACHVSVLDGVLDLKGEMNTWPHP